MASIMDNDSFRYDVIQPSMIIDETSTSEYYIGTSDNGIDLGKATWRIKRVWKVGNVWRFGYPSGNQKFEYVWDDRYTYTYI